MPLVVIHAIEEAYTPDQLQAIGNVIYTTMREHYHAPNEDRYQIITQHKPYEMMCSDTGLGFNRSNKLLFLQIVQQGRSGATKQQFYAKVMEGLKATVDLQDADLIMSTTSNTKDDWSFGAGQAQFLTGQL